MFLFPDPRTPKIYTLSYTTLFRSNDSGACGAAAGPQLRIGILAERRYLSQSQPSGTIASLRALGHQVMVDRKSTRLNSSHGSISYAVFCLKKKTKTVVHATTTPHT